ncbi:hypothetical protein [Kitasatospora sp. GAS204B]|uniref:hypothetical protein n=1 Tax=unclassified Kitasatospora TaxID=2633591 RepID=UPI0024733DD2|nr:hypothetical protein [Kitasatospora sp. GAS204B]MDH6119701.1 hypothetical protein [Kitasatospora sp. GAS204B]
MTSAKKLLAATAIAGLAIAVSGPAYASTVPRGSSTGPITTHPHLSFTQADNSRTITIGQGVDVSVDLAGGCRTGLPGGRWSAPAISDPSVLHLQASSAQPDGTSVVSFLTDQVGTSEVTADLSCAPAQVILPFHLKINVVAD